MFIRPYIIAANLIPQPTWGGNYIFSLKSLNHQSSQLIGQSYELYSHSLLSTHTSTRHQKPFTLGSSSNPLSSTPNQPSSTLINIQDLISSNPLQVLGSKTLKLHGPKINILIKLTQAQANSYQLHVKSPALPHHPSASTPPQWLPKPESWYFLRPGLITLGLKSGINPLHYQDLCHQIDKLSQHLSSQIKSKTLSHSRALSKLQSFLSTHHPTNFVNTLSVPKDCAIDLSEGGIHHSWESNPQTHPDGNIVYEIQQNVFDTDSTLRSFDQGKLQPDGALRPLHIDDYFSHLDTSPTSNLPSTHILSKPVLKHTSTHTIRQIFSTKHYCLQQLTFTNKLSNQYTTTTDSFHHLFARRGHFQLEHQSTRFTLTQGFSIFVPASVGSYTLIPYRTRSSQVLKTYV